jgi:hypothetical protein
MIIIQSLRLTESILTASAIGTYGADGLSSLGGSMPYHRYLRNPLTYGLYRGAAGIIVLYKKVKFEVFLILQTMNYLPDKQCLLLL